MKRKKKLYSLFSMENAEEYLNVRDNSSTPEEELENKEFEKNFLNVLNKLPEKQRETFSLRYFDKLSYEEISEMLGTSVGGLKANYFQAVQKLTKLLKNELH